MRIFWLLMTVSLVACNTGGKIKSASASSDRKPGWISGENADYPSRLYITGTGSASSLEVAKNRARANLSKVFEAKIKAQTESMEDIKTKIRNGKETFTKDINVLEKINISTDEVLEGTRIAETWKDKSVFEYYALAVLERSQAGKNIRQQIDALDAATETDLARSQSAGDQLLAMAAVDKAYRSQLERQVLQRTLKIIDLKGVGKPAKWNLADLRAKLENTLLAMKISVEANGDAKLAQLVKGAMSKAGFPASNGQGDFRLVSTMNTVDVGMRQGWYWLRGKITVKLIEAASGKVRGTHSWNLKVSANSKGVALSRLMTKADKQMKKDLKNIVLKFATAVGS